MSVQLAMRHFVNDFNGRHLIIFSDHRPLIGSFSNNDLQSHDPLAQNAINEIAQFTSDIRFKAGKEIPIADWLSRPEGCPIGKAYDVTQPPHTALKKKIDYVSPEATVAALEAIALQTLSPEKIARDQKLDRQVQAHLKGQLPQNVVVSTNVRSRFSLRNL